MDSPAVLTPPINGHYRLVISRDLHPLVVRHITLHEIGHILAGDVDEPTFITWSGPLPPTEDLVDLFSLVALLDEAELGAGREFIETRIRELVPMQDRGWQVHRIPRLARKLARLTTAGGSA